VDALAIAALEFHPQRHRLPDGQTITGRPKASAPAHLITLDGKLVRCQVASFGRSLWLPEGAELVVNGMSGEPILDLRGRAIGVISTGTAANPYLMGNLPTWMTTNG
jgi:hypothetical protein